MNVNVCVANIKNRSTNILNIKLSCILFTGREKIAQILIEKGANINTTNNNGVSALLFASAKASESIVKLLIENGADINAVDMYNSSALILSIQSSKH